MRLILAQLVCDHDNGCAAAWPAEPTEHLDHREARRAGWLTHGKEALCPDHNPFRAAPAGTR